MGACHKWIVFKGAHCPLGFVRAAGSIGVLSGTHICLLGLRLRCRINWCVKSTADLPAGAFSKVPD